MQCFVRPRKARGLSYFFGTKQNAFSLLPSKSRKYAAWPIKIDRYGLGMRCGHDPCFFGIYAQQILLTENILEYEYKIVEVADDPRHIVFQIKRQSLTVNV